MGVAEIPQDIIDLIIDVISETSTEDVGRCLETLSSCALVCQGFLTRSRHHLFSEITLGSPTDMDCRKARNARLLSILADNAGIANNIVGLNLRIPPDDMHWIAEDPDFQRIMTIAHTDAHPIRRLTLDGREHLRYSYFHGGGHRGSAGATHTLRRFLGRVVHTLTTLSFQYMDSIPLDCVMQCSQLCSFEFSDSHIDDASIAIVAQNPVQFSRPLTPRSLKFHGACDAFAKAGILDSSEVTMLSIKSTEGNLLKPQHSFTKTMTAQAGNKLQELSFTIMRRSLSHTTEPINERVDLSLNPNLHSLSTGLEAGSLVASSFLFRYIEVLQTIPDKNRLRSIHLNILTHPRTAEDCNGLFTGDWNGFATEIERIRGDVPTKRLDVVIELKYGKGWGTGTYIPDASTLSKIIALRIVEEKLGLLTDNPNIYLTFNSSLLV